MKKTKGKKDNTKKYRKEITEMKQIELSLFMVPPLKSKHKNINLVGEIQDEESLSISDDDSFTKQRKAKEKWVHDYQIIIAKRQQKNKEEIQPLLGIKFPNNAVVYMTGKFITIKGNIVGYTNKKHNVLINLPKKGKIFMGLQTRTRCDLCSRTLVKVYRCYDCKPRKSYKKTDMCKTCYKKRRHDNHRVVMLEYSDKLFDEHEYLIDLF